MRIALLVAILCALFVAHSAKTAQPPRKVVRVDAPRTVRKAPDRGRTYLLRGCVPVTTPGYRGWICPDPKP